jgi:hypothetical protein
MSGITKGKLLSSETLNRQQSFFEETMTILLTSFSFMTSMQLLKTRYSPVLEYDAENLAKIDFPFAAIGERKLYSFKAFEILSRIAEKIQIDEIKYEVYEKTLENISNVANATIFENQDTFYFIRKIISGCYLTYFEKIKNGLMQKYGTNTTNWPTQLDFARIVRNAFAHDNIITIQNPNNAPVIWKHLTYGPADNGKNIFADFYVVEIIDLMKEIDALL